VTRSAPAAADAALARRQALLALADLQRHGRPQDVAAVRAHALTLRNLRDVDTMGTLVEALARLDPRDATVGCLYAQQLIDTGRPAAALDRLQALVRRLPAEAPEAREATGLLGRAWKQIFIELARHRVDRVARDALKRSLEAYGLGFERDAVQHVWHGVNLLALLDRARRLGVPAPRDLDMDPIAARVRAVLDAVPDAERDAWHLASRAELALAAGEAAALEAPLRDYLAHPQLTAFQVASTLRQFTEVWELDRQPHGRLLVDLLRARLLELHGGETRLSPEDLQRVRAQPAPAAGQLEAILGVAGTHTYRWWKTGVERAASVGAIRQRFGGRTGTGFVVRAGDLGLEPPDERLVLTNFHVVNPQGASPGLRPEDAEIVFEAVDAGRPHALAEVVWSSPIAQHDACLLRVDPPIADVPPLPLAPALPALEGDARVYIVGHPGGRDLAFSFQDNELLDHEGPPHGAPPIPGVVRLHYRAPTEGGSSGSPVFNARSWQVIGLHHYGGRAGVSRLNGQPGTYGANEGIAMQSIVAAIRS
jgi:S1-C subfamily serine protease